jgi:hypothetical protein
MELACVVTRYVKKLLVGLPLWKARPETDLKTDRDAMEKVEGVSLNGCRAIFRANAISKLARYVCRSDEMLRVLRVGR